MRIAHVTATFPPYFGGTGNVCLGNARALASRGHDVHVFTASAPGLPAPRDERRDDGVTVHRLRPLFRVGNGPCLPGLARLGDFDVVHLHYPFVFGAEWVALAEAARRFPLVLTAHQDLAFRGALGLAQRAYEAVVKRRLVARARRVCVPTLDYTRASSLAREHARAPHRFVEVPNGVDATRLAPGEAPRALRERYAPKGERVVLFVGGLDPPHRFKGVDVLLEAMALLGGDARLVVVGDGSLRPGLEAHARRLGVAERVAFAGRVEDEALPDHYRLADVVALPSTTTEEIFGLALAEAMACGKPVVGTRLPGVRTVVDDGVNGLLARPGDARDLARALGALLALPDVERRAMGRAGRTKARSRYAWSAIGKTLESVYEEVTHCASGSSETSRTAATKA